MSASLPKLIATGAVTCTLLGGCTPWLGRGDFALVASDDAVTENYAQIGTEAVSGEACFTGRQADDLIFSWAVEDALSKPEAEGATVLLDAHYTGHKEDKSSCITVEGYPARSK